MHLMADPVPRTREVNAVLGGDALQEPVIVGVLETGLEHVVIDVADGQLGLDPRDTHRLELEVGHRPGRILGEGLIYPDRDLFPGNQLPGDPVCLENLLNQVHAHHSPLHLFSGIIMTIDLRHRKTEGEINRASTTYLF